MSPQDQRRADERETERDNERDNERDRRATNIFLLVLFLAVAGGGIWLGKAMIDARRADDCIAQGRRNCVPIEVPPR